MVSVAIIGAGISGLTAANILKNCAKIKIFEKARGVGGRMSTRRAQSYHFDHGAQFFTAKTKEFQSFLSPMIKSRIVQRWDARFAEFQRRNIVRQAIWDESRPHYVGVPGMNAMAKYLAEDLDVFIDTRIAKIEKKNGWHLIDVRGNSVGHFDWVISTAPAEQAAELMPESFIHHGAVSSAKMLGCFSLMLGFQKPLRLDFDAALVRGSDISWISVNSSKPERPGGFSLLVQSSNQWAEKHLEDDGEKVMEYLSAETMRIIGQDMSLADHRDIHRWLYANIEKQDDHKPLIDFDRRLAACGDWRIQGRVESAFTSGLSVARALLDFIQK